MRWQIHDDGGVEKRRSQQQAIVTLSLPGFVTRDDDDDYSFSLFKSQQPLHALSRQFLEHIYQLDPPYALHMVHRSLMSLANEHQQQPL